MIASCEAEKDTPCRTAFTQTEIFTSAELNYWPYHSNDTLSFVDALNDTIRFTIPEPVHTFRVFPRPNNPECPDDSQAYPHRSISMQSLSGSQTILYDLDAYDESVTVKFDGQTFVLTIPGYGDPTYIYSDSMRLIGNLFTSVYAVSPQSGDTMYFNTANGIIRMVRPGKSLTLWP